jgi:hypothetical protein
MLPSIFASLCYCQRCLFSFAEYIEEVFVETCVRCTPLEWERKKICFIYILFDSSSSRCLQTFQGNVEHLYLESFPNKRVKTRLFASVCVCVCACVHDTKFKFPVTYPKVLSSNSARRPALLTLSLVVFSVAPCK